MRTTRDWFNEKKETRPWFRVLRGGVMWMALCVLAIPANAQGQSAAGASAPSEEVLSGFEETPQILEGGFDEISPKDEPGGEGKPSWWSLDGFARLDAAYAYAHEAPEPGAPDYRGLSKLRTTLQLELPLKLGKGWKGFLSGQANRDWVYSLRDEKNYSDEVVEQYEQEVEWKEVWLNGTLGSLMDLKIGRQIVVWGKSDYVRVNDILNPVDNREPGLVDIEDMRLPVTMTRLDFFVGAWSLTAVAVHEIRFDKLPVQGSEFYPIPFPMPPEEIPAHGGGNTEYGMALQGAFSGWDLGLYYARVFEDFPHVESATGEKNPFLCLQPGGCVVRHSELTQAGLAVAIAVESWLFKAEAAQVQGLEFFNLPGNTKTRLDLLGGVEYAGITDQSITLEVVNRKLLDFDPVQEAFPDQASENVVQTVFGYRADLLRQTLDVSLVAILYGTSGEEGGIYRAGVGYDLADAFHISGPL